MNRTSQIVSAACGVLASLPASASEADLQVLRAEIAQMRQTYEQRIEALEKRLVQAESNSTQAKAPAEKSTPPAARAGDGKASSFNPEIGLVLQGQYKNMKDVPERQVSGYWPAGHDHGGDKRGLSLEHSELMFSANIDPNFRGVARFAVTGDGKVEVEEASVSTLGRKQKYLEQYELFVIVPGYQPVVPFAMKRVALDGKRSKLFVGHLDS